MKKASKQTRQVEITRVHGYHEGGWESHTNYAYLGFKTNKYFTSDRFIKLDENFNRPDGKPLKGIGFEIETECWGIKNQTVYAEVLNKIILSEFPDDMFKLQRDGSLGGETSAEIISQVLTKEAVRNNYPAFKAMFDVYFPSFDVSCVRTGQCGMHMNLSNALFGAREDTQAEAIKKLLYIVNKHFEFFCYLVNRSYENTGYCEQMLPYTNAKVCKAADLAIMGGSHHICFNASHYTEGRIELRIVGGQKNFACFRNTVESVFHIIEAVKKLSWADCNDLVKIFSGCNQYVFDRINTKCKQAGTITTAQLEAIQRTVIREKLL